ncbi:MAG: N-6 DNA methylase [Anaerolineae bacterium]
MIDDFTYDHSEKLGDAFEYLLSVLDSQGDAGQFRTPRHIIEFMVKVIDPQKGESILDPACGTAGFLISSYKHIMAANARNGRPGAALTPDERTRLLNHIQGYDISPDMVRLSLVNLYLHGFSDPHIVEYDTLTSEDRWNEYYDIIMANPPFMSPKGGIKPHKRFSVQSKRSEVLFVDYIAEHLSPNGRAAVIVPEGIIFQNGNAYKRLRKMLVDEYLVGVISLPAGVFNPYSGVKTSILWLDKALAKQSDQIAFVKIEHDGFGLGAQRRPIKQNDLPAALAAITAYKASVVNGTDFDAEEYASLTLVNKEEIAKNDDYNLSGERYKQQILFHSDYEFVDLGNVCEFKRGPFGGSLKKEIFVESGYAVYEQSHAINDDFSSVRYFITEEKFDEMQRFALNSGDLIMSCSGTMGRIAIVPENIAPGIINQALLKFTPSQRINAKYLKYIIESDSFQLALSSQTYGAAIKNVASVKVLKKIQIPLPPLAVQEEIVAEIEGYQKIIDGARQVVENYRPRIPINPDWPLVELGNLFDIFNGGTPSKRNEEYWNGDIPWVSPKDMKFDVITDSIDKITEKAIAESSTKQIPENSILIVVRSGILKHSLPVALTGVPVTFNQDINAMIPKKNGKMSSKFLFYYLKTVDRFLLDSGIKRGGTVHSFHSKFLKTLEIPLPDSDTQNQIVAEIEQEQALVQANRQLITRFEQKIKERIGRVWGAS